MVEFTPFNDKISVTAGKDSVKAAQGFTQYLTILEDAIREQATSWTSLTVPAVTGTSFDVTGIPTTAQEVRVLWKDITFDVADRVALQPLVGGVIDIADILCQTRHTASTSTSRILTTGVVGTAASYGTQTLTKFSDINSWSSTGNSVIPVGVSVSESTFGLIGALDGLRITVSAGNNYTGGTVAVLYR